jgi:hypothetical protein
VSISIICPQVADASLRAQLSKSVSDAIRRWRPGFERWHFTLFRSQSGDGWDLAMRGPRFRKVLTLYGPTGDLPGLVTAYIDALLRTE